MTTEELLALSPDFTNVSNLRRVRNLLVGNRLLKDALIANPDATASVLPSLINYMFQETERLQSLQADQLASINSITELTELILVLNSLVITHPNIILEHDPRRFISSIIMLMQTRNYDLTLSCLRLFKGLLTHCIPDADLPMRQIVTEILTITSDLFCDQKLVRLFIMSMMKNDLVKELILGILAGLTCYGKKTSAAVGAGSQLESYCNIKTLLHSGSSERMCFYTLVCYYNLILLADSRNDQELGDILSDIPSVGSDVCAKNISDLPTRLVDCTESMEILSLLHNALYTVRLRCIAVTILLRLYIVSPEKFEEHKSTYVPRLLQGFSRLAEMMVRNPKGFGELGRALFRDMAICVYSVSPAMVSLISHCNHMCVLIDTIDAANAEWRILLNNILTAFSLRLESVRLQVASLTVPQRVLKGYSCDSPRDQLISDMTFIFALSRSVEVIRSLLVDYPNLVDTTVAVMRRARSTMDFDVLCLAIKLLTNLALPIAGALHNRYLERQVGRALGDIVQAKAELPLKARLYALSALTNLALCPDASDVVASAIRGASGNLDSASTGSRNSSSGTLSGSGGVTLRHPLSPQALMDLLDEANDLSDDAQRQQLVACVAQFARNVMGIEESFEDDDDEEDDDDKDNHRDQLKRLAKGFLQVINASNATFGPIAKEASLLAVSSIAASRRLVPMPLSVDWANQLISSYIREPATPNCQLAAMLAINYLDELDFPWRRRVRQEMATAEVATAIRSEGARFLREKFLTEMFREEEMATMSGSESS